MTEREPIVDEAEARRLAAGRRIMERIRNEANDEYGYFDGREGEDVFQSLYLTPRHMSIPEHLVSDNFEIGIQGDIRELFFQVYDGIRAELLDRYGRDAGIWLVVDASADDSTTTVLCAEGTVLLIDSMKAWNLWWEDEQAMAHDLGDWYERAAARYPTDPNNTYGTERT